MLEYDAARKIAQGLGVNLDEWEIGEVKGETARLLPVKERARSFSARRQTKGDRRRDARAAQNNSAISIRRNGRKQ